MIWLIAKKDFLSNIVTSGFMMGLVLCLVLIPYTMYTGIREYENRLAQYEADINQAEDVYNKSYVYATVNPVIVKPVSPLSIFSKGILEQTGSKVELQREEKPVFSSDIVTQSENPFMSDFLSLDFTTALTILLSLLGVLFSYDMLSREKEQGTLKLALSNPVGRSTFFLGKLTGIFLTLMPVLILCFLIVLLMIQFSPSVHFSAGEYGRVAMLIVVSFIYFAFFVFVGGFVSSRTKSSTSSIIVNLFIWCFLLFLLPNAVGYLGKNITKANDYKQLTILLQQMDNEVKKNINEGVEKTLNDEGLQHRGYYMCSGGGWDGGFDIMFTRRATIEYERRKKELANPLILDNSDKKWSLQADYLQQLYRQEKTIRYLSYLSPAEIFKLFATLFCRTGMDAEVNFMNQARLFQDIFYGYYVQNKIFSSYAYITKQKESEIPETGEEGHAQYQAWRKNLDAGMSDADMYPYVDTSGFPRFAYIQPTLGNDLQSQLYLIAGILFVCILLFWFSFVSFIKYDVR